MMIEIENWAQFYNHCVESGDDPKVCRISGALFPWALPRIEPQALLAAALADPKARVLEQSRGGHFDSSVSYEDKYRSMPIAEAAGSPNLHVSLFDLSRLSQSGGVLASIANDVFAPMERMWRDAGLDWDGPFWPILFISGSAAATNYHIDPTCTLTWHLFGRKRYLTPKMPDRWCGENERKDFLEQGIVPKRPDGLTDDDALWHDNEPGDLVWTPTFIPHWVDSYSLSATITFAFRNLRVCEPVLNGDGGCL